MCGIHALIDDIDIIKKLINGLFHLQHRGQEASGICVLNQNNKYLVKKSYGLLKKLINNEIYDIKGQIGFGHLRYSTNTNHNLNSIQPFIKNHIMMCYNGNIHNYEEIYNFLIQSKVILKNKSESYLFFKLIEYYSTKILQTSDIIQFIKNINNICKGAYSVIVYIKDIGLISFKDKYGLKPLLYSTTNCVCALSSESIS